MASSSMAKSNGTLNYFRSHIQNDSVSKPIGRMILFGAKLNVKIPSDHHIHPSAPSPSESPTSPADFEIKTRNSPILCPFSLPSPVESPKSLTGFGIMTQYSPILGPPSPPSPVESPKSQADFGIKTRNLRFQGTLNKSSSHSMAAERVTFGSSEANIAPQKKCLDAKKNEISDVDFFIGKKMKGRVAVAFGFGLGRGRRR
ncbi:unnamed protein product [Fraxinus pennsylvanica]|uniref:Uncharacterized protein n=1 Tax=Fraxinus pennsylvanica TaxID=56036 RepID=A0AAD2E0F3_9LAMI|nr:unnamed protein product [Fraxinus pennsylvanica]